MSLTETAASSTPPELCRSTGAVTLTGRLFPSGDPARLEFVDGKASRIEPAPRPDEPPGGQRWVVPGFFDLQVNGFAGRAFVSPRITVEDCEHIAAAVLATGTTRFLATVITAPIDQMLHQIETIAAAIENSPLFSQTCAGIHMEGPFIHPEDGPRGAHPKSAVLPPDLTEYARLRDAARGRLRIMTVSPEQPGAIELIRKASSDGVLVAMGHHRADQAAIDAAIAAGARMCTHLGNGFDAMVPRLDNPLWRQLGDDRLMASFICDGHHLPPPAARCLLRAKGVERSILITDAVAAAGMPPGRYQLGHTEVELTDTGRVVLPGTPYLAGSAADMPLVIGHAVIDAGVSWQQAIMMAAGTPADLLGLGEAWPPEPGQSANAVELDWCPAAGKITIRRVLANSFSVDKSTG